MGTWSKQEFMSAHHYGTYVVITEILDDRMLVCKMQRKKEKFFYDTRKSMVLNRITFEGETPEVGDIIFIDRGNRCSLFKMQQTEKDLLH